MKTLAHNILVAFALAQHEREHILNGLPWPPSREGVRCFCPDPACTNRPCTLCGNDCSSTAALGRGRCVGQCPWCGGPCPPRRDGAHPSSPFLFESYCSDACCDAAAAQAEAEGRVLKVQDLTLERVNEIFRANGLGLRGVGPVTPS